LLCRNVVRVTGAGIKAAGLPSGAAPPWLMWWQVPNRTGTWRPTAWLRWSDSNSETSSQNIPLKGRLDCPDPAEFCPQRLFAFELRRWGYAARASCQDLSRRSCADVSHRAAIAAMARIAAIFCRSRDDPAAANPAHHCSLCAGLFPQRERVLWSRTASLMALLLSPASARRPPRGLGGGGAMLRQPD
jgi:hypothetical protein